jgi:hypothetical protein
MKISELLESKKPEFMQPGNMKPKSVSGKPKAGAVEQLKQVLLKAKADNKKLDYDGIDRMMQKICGEYNLTGDELHDKFVDNTGMIPDNWIKRQKIKDIMTEQDITESLSNLSNMDKIVFLEEYVARNGMLRESNSNHDIEYFTELLDLSVDPLPGKNYIAVSLMLVSDRIMMFQRPIIGKFVGANQQNDLEFIDSDSGDSVTFPPKVTSRVKSITGTFIFDSMTDYEKFKTIMILKWDFKLPDFDEFISEQSKKYIGPTTKVKNFTNRTINVSSCFLE